MIRNWVRKAILELLIDDNSTYPLVQVSYNDIPTDAQRMSVYGVSSMPPRDAMAIILSPKGHADDPIAILDDVINRFKPLNEHEVQIGNYKTRSSIKFATGGDVVINLPTGGSMRVAVSNGGIDINVSGSQGVTLTSAGDVQLTCPNVAITGNVQITGTVTVTGLLTATVDVQAGVASTSLAGHTHNETGTGGGVTGPPNP